MDSIDAIWRKFGSHSCACNHCSFQLEFLATLHQLCRDQPGEKLRGHCFLQQVFDVYEQQCPADQHDNRGASYINHGRASKFLLVMLFLIRNASDTLFHSSSEKADDWFFYQLCVKWSRCRFDGLSIFACNAVCRYTL